MSNQFSDSAAHRNCLKFSGNYCEIPITLTTGVLSEIAWFRQ
jgi:hypothetical protein